MTRQDSKAFPRVLVLETPHVSFPFCSSRASSSFTCLFFHFFLSRSGRVTDCERTRSCQSNTPTPRTSSPGSSSTSAAHCSALIHKESQPRTRPQLLIASDLPPISWSRSTGRRQRWSYHRITHAALKCCEAADALSLLLPLFTLGSLFALLLA